MWNGEQVWMFYIISERYFHMYLHNTSTTEGTTIKDVNISFSSACILSREKLINFSLCNVTRWVAFISVAVGKCQSEDSFVCFGVKPTHRACALISHETGRRRGKEGPRVSQEKETEETRAENKPVDRTGQSAEESRCYNLWTQARLANMRRSVSIPGEFVGVSLEYTLAIAPRMLGKCLKLLPSCAWS